MAKKFIQYRKVTKGGIVSDGVLKDNSGVVGVYDTAEEAPQNMEDQWHTYVTVEYDFDPTVDSLVNLKLNAAEDGFDKKWTGKTVAEQLELHHEAEKVQSYKEKKSRLKKAINVKAGERIEGLEGWRIERAKQQDFLAGSTSNQTAIYQTIENVRSTSNTKQGELSPLDPSTAAGQAAIDAFDPNDFGGAGPDTEGSKDSPLLATTQDYDHTKA